MPAADAAFGWGQAVIGLSVVVVAAFLVSWLTTEVLHASRAVYIGVLAIVSLGLGWAYLAWSGTSPSDLVTHAGGWAVVAGVAAAALVVPLVRKLPRGPRPAGSRLAGLLLWEAVVYGVGEAVLLAALPVLTAWQAMAAAGWTDGGWQEIASGALAVGASLLVIGVHHLGYAEFRQRAARVKLVGALVTCGVQAVAFLVTGNVLAPVVAHILLHAQMLLRGVELPPVTPRAPEGLRLVGAPGRPEVRVG